MNAPIVIRTSGLTKRYPGSKSKALDKLTIAIAAGEVYGFLGANGAGKSTTIRLLMNFLQPTAGTAQICGLDCVKDSVEVKRKVGYLAGDVALYGKATGQELLTMLSRLQGNVDTKELRSLASRFDADLTKPISTLSKGNKQKIGIIQAFMHKPDVLILDEPTSGLDPLMQEVFYDLVKERSSQGAAVFVSSHNLNEVRHMCDRVGIIRNGVLLTQKSVSEMDAAAKQQFVITFADAVPSELQDIADIHIIAKNTTTVTLHVAGSLTPLLKILARHHVIGLQSEQLDLEQAFLQFYGKGAKQ